MFEAHETLAAMARPRLPKRSSSTLTSGPPADASKPDDAAIADVYREISSTGSLAAAAKKLEQYAHLSPGSERSDGKPSSPVNVLSQASQARPPWADDPEEAEYMNASHGGNGYDEVDDDVVISSEDEYEGEVIHLQEVVEGLWIGDLVAAMNTDGLEQRGITNILSLLRPALEFSPQFSVFALEIDDSADTDILTHLPSCVAWIQAALDLRRRSLDPSAGMDAPQDLSPDMPVRAPQPTPGGVLVHCQAGMSRSATVCAAFLMRTLELDPVDAVTMLREKRPVVDPSETFWYQLGLFYNADGRVSLKDRSTRQFYMERTTSQFMNGDGGAPPLDKMAKYPATPTPSNPPTPMGGHGRRKIRCKMCRRHLAVREHMMDHILDQAPVSRPRTPSNFTLPSPVQSSIPGFTSRRQSILSDVINPLTGLPGATPRSRHASMSSGVPSPAPMQTTHDRETSKDSSSSSNGSAFGNPLSPGVPLPRTTTPGLILTSSSPEVSTQGKLIGNKDLPHPHAGGSLPTRVEQPPSPKSISRAASTPTESASAPVGRVLQSADQLASRLPPHLLALRTAGLGSNGLSSPFTSSPSSPEKEKSSITMAASQNGSNAGAGPTGATSATASPGTTGSAARRMSLLSMTPAEGRERRGSGAAGDLSALAFSAANAGPPILVNPKCSGYFVEPLTWMEPVLKNGEIAGKLVCPNEKCGAKIGNFDWAGVQCGCKEWVTPGFCISRSKVDEVW